MTMVLKQGFDAQVMEVLAEFEKKLEVVGATEANLESVEARIEELESLGKAGSAEYEKAQKARRAIKRELAVERRRADALRERLHTMRSLAGGYND